LIAEEPQDERYKPTFRLLNEQNLATAFSLAGTTVLDSGGMIDCTIRDRSAFGSRLKIASVIGTPDVFALVVGGGGEQHAVNVA
jgi:hypothetical protein